MEVERESMDYDVVVVGAGPSGLSTAIKLKQLNPEFNVCILEKGSEVGAHLVMLFTWVIVFTTISQQYKKQIDLLTWKNTELQHIGRTGKR